jgi:CheY-like chemotaxis protein
MPNIILVCEPSQIDPALRRSIAHLAKSCEISIVHDGYDFFDELSVKAFDLIVIDFEVPGVDSLELVESVQYVDPGVPVILMLKQEHRAIRDTARRLKSHPMSRPFKPLRFLRLVDKQLHQHLNKYRRLSAALTGVLEWLRTQTNAPCAFLVEDTGQILISSGEVAGISPSVLGRLAVDGFALEGDIKKLFEQAEAQGVHYQLEQKHGVYAILIVENLYLALVLPIAAELQQDAETWQSIEIAANRVRAALYDQVEDKVSPSGAGIDPTARLFIPLKRDLNESLFHPPDEPDEAAINWEIVSNTSSMLSRMDKFCRLD